MKFALFLLLAPFACGLARADDDEYVFTPLTMEERRERLLGQRSPVGNGYDDLVAAALVLDNDTASPAMILNDRTPAQKQEQRRTAVESNQQALELIRRALGRGVARPQPSSQPSLFVSANGSIRQLWRMLDVEGDFYANEGDAARALNSYLDGLELGAVASSGGTWLDSLATSVQSESREDIATLAPQLDAAQLRVLARRVREIERRRPAILDYWRVTKQVDIELLRSVWREIAQGTAGERVNALQQDGDLTLAQARQVSRLSEQQITQQAAERYDTIMQRTLWPFARRVREPLPPTNAYVENYLPGLPHKMEQLYRYQRARNLLLADALELRALKLETGAYPATFKAATDPFGDDSTFIYRSAGDAYVLYSVGPNGTDENATPIAKGALAEVLPDGDIVAPKLKARPSQRGLS